jgi:hypothetical protein
MLINEEAKKTMFMKAVFVWNKISVKGSGSMLFGEFEYRIEGSRFFLTKNAKHLP